MKENKIKLSYYVFAKITETLVGIESACYKIASGVIPQPKPFAMKELIDPSFKNVITRMVINQYNIEYKGLSEKSDLRIMRDHKMMNDMVDHSPLCLIHIILRLATDFVDKTERSLLDNSSYENYIASIQSQFKYMAPAERIEKFSDAFTHECKGPRVVEPIPDDGVLFNIGDKPQTGVRVTPIARCMVCNKETKLLCQGCKTKDGPKYYICSRQCQKLDWPTHKNECLLYK